MNYCTHCKTWHHDNTLTCRKSPIVFPPDKDIKDELLGKIRSTLYDITPESKADAQLCSKVCEIIDVLTRPEQVIQPAEPDEVEKLKNQNIDLICKASKLESEVVALQTENRNLSVEIKSLKEHQDQVCVGLNNRTKEVGELRERCREKTGTIAALQLIIGAICHGQEIDEDIASELPAMVKVAREHIIKVRTITADRDNLREGVRKMIEEQQLKSRI